MWAKGEAKDIEDSYDPRIVGRLLQTIVDQDPIIVLTAMQKSNFSESDNLQEAMVRGTVLLGSTNDLEKMSRSVNDINTDTLIIGQDQSHIYASGFELLRKGLIPDGYSFPLDEMIKAGTFNREVKPSDEWMLKSLERHIEKMSDYEETRELFRGGIVWGIIEAEVGGGQEPDADHLNKLVTLAGKEAGVLLSTLYADRPKDIVPPEVATLIGQASGLDSNAVEFTIEELTLNPKIVRPDSFLAEILNKSQLDSKAVAKAITIVTDHNEGEWRCDNGPVVEQWIERQLEGSMLTDRDLGRICCSCLGFDKGLPPFVEKYIQSHKAELITQQNNASIVDGFTYRGSGNYWGEPTLYPDSVEYQFLQKGKEILPKDVQEIVAAHSQKQDYRQMLAQETLELIFQNGYEYSRMLRRIPSVEEQVKNGLLWQIIHPDLWKIVSDGGPETLVYFMRYPGGSFGKDNAKNISWGYGEGQSREVSLDQLFAPEVKKAMADQLVVRSTTSEEALRQLAYLAPVIGTEFTADLPAIQQWVVKRSMDDPVEGKKITELLGDIILDKDQGKWFTTVDNQQVLTKEGLLKLVEYKIDAIHGWGYLLDCLENYHLVDVDNRAMFTTKEAATIDLLLRSRGDIGKDLLTLKDGALTFDEGEFDKSFTVNEQKDESGKLSRVITLTYEGFLKKINSVHEYDKRLPNYLKSQVIDFDLLFEGFKKDIRPEWKSYSQGEKSLLLYLADVDDKQNRVPEYIAQRRGFSPDEINEIGQLAKKDIFKNYEARWKLAELLSDVGATNKDVLFTLLRDAPQFFSDTRAFGVISSNLSLLSSCSHESIVYLAQHQEKIFNSLHALRMNPYEDIRFVLNTSRYSVAEFEQLFESVFENKGEAIYKLAAELWQSSLQLDNGSVSDFTTQRIIELLSRPSSSLDNLTNFVGLSLGLSPDEVSDVGQVLQGKETEKTKLVEGMLRFFGLSSK